MLTTQHVGAYSNHMENLIRRTFALTKRQMAYLSERATTMGISVADAVRRIIDDHMDKK